MLDQWAEAFGEYRRVKHHMLDFHERWQPREDYPAWLEADDAIRRRYDWCRELIALVPEREPTNELEAEVQGARRVAVQMVAPPPYKIDQDDLWNLIILSKPPMADPPAVPSATEVFGPVH